MTELATTLRAAASRIQLDAISKSYETNEVIPSMSVELAAGEFTVILGPSGCGKSTLLQMIAGLEKVSSGKIRIGSQEVQDLEPKRRGCAMVFQNYALYPHMSVRENIAYSLKVAGIPKTERTERVRAVAAMLALSDYLDRRPGQLSGGQRQRVAIGRAIVREPAVLLFDEPLSNLDAKLRHEMRIELAELHCRIGATTVFVTHDQAEAMTLADRILVMNKGQIEQFDTPRQVYGNPASTFVAGFIGSPPMNIFRVRGDGAKLCLENGEAVMPSSTTGDVLLGIRPEHIAIVAQGSSFPTFRARIDYREHLGSHEILNVSLASGETFTIATQLGDELGYGRTELELQFPPEHIHLFDVHTGKSLSVKKKVN